MPKYYFSTETSRAFTLIELLLVVSIVIIITGAMIPGFSTYIRSQYVTQGLEQVKTDLRTIQNRALTGQNALDTVGTNIYPNYWGVQFTSGNNRYSYFISQTNNACPPATNIVQKGFSSTLPGDAEVKSTRCVFFSLTNGDTSSYPGVGVNGDIHIIMGRRNISTDCKRLILGTGGLIDASSTLTTCN